MNLCDADKIYKSCAALEKIPLLRVHDEEFLKYSSKLNALRSCLGDPIPSEWGFISEMQRFFYRASELPLSFDNISIVPARRPEALKMLVPPFDARLKEQALEVLSVLGKLLERKENPLLDAIVAKKCIPPSGRTAIVINHYHRIFGAELTRTIRARTELTQALIINERELRERGTFDALVYIGPMRKFEAWNFASPRSSQISIVSYSWLSESPPAHPCLAGARVPRPSLTIVASGTRPATEIQWHRQDDTDWQELISRSSSAGIHSPVGSTDTEARLVLLAGDCFTYVESDPNDKVRVLDWKTRAVEKITTDQLEPGMFLLVKSGQGGDYIVDVTNRILGEEAAKIATTQQQWKLALQRKADECGSVPELANLLKRHGSPNGGSHMNVRNWMSLNPRKIKPLSPKDFGAIMEVLELSGVTAECWKNAQKLSVSRRSAGNRLDTALRQRVSHTESFEKLLREGQMDFEIPGIEGLKLTAYEVNEISPQLYSIPESSLGVIFKQ